MIIWEKNIAKLILPTPYPVGDVNVYLVKGDALTLIDTGAKTEDSKEALSFQLGELGLKIKDIEQVILTHHHPDHAGALSFFEQDVPVYGHQNNQRWLEWNDEFVQLHDRFFFDIARQFGVAEELRAKLVDYRDEMNIYTKKTLSGFLSEGDSLPGLPGWTAIETLGHAQSHLSFLREKDGVSIGGDHLLARISPNPIMEPPLLPGGERPRPLLQYNQSLEKMMKLPISKVYSGHGIEIENVNELIEFQVTRQHNRAMLVKEMLKEKPLTAFEVCQRLFPRVYQIEVGLTMWETIGQLDYLANIGEIESDIQDDAIRYVIV